MSQFLLELTDIGAAEIAKNLGGSPETWKPHAAWAIGAAIRKLREPKDATPYKVGPKEMQVAMSVARGYTGDACRDCGNFTLVRNGTCLKCESCGSTTGCS